MLHYADSLYNAQKIKSPYSKAGRLIAFSNYYDLNNDSQRGFAYNDSAIAIIDQENLRDTSWARYYFVAHIKKANEFFKIGDYPRAIEGFFKMKELADKRENKCTVGVHLDNNIGRILYRQQKYEEAIRYFREALGTLDDCSVDDNRNKIAIQQELLDNIGESFANGAKIDSALVYYHKALHVIETGRFSTDPVQDKISRTVSKGVVLSNIAQVFVNENKLDSAELYFNENIAINAISYKNEIKNAQQSQLDLASLYNLKKEYPKMRQVLGGLRKSLDTIRNDDGELGWRKLMAEYDSKNKLPLQELKYYKSYISLKDSLDQVRKAADESDISKELKAKEQQMEISLLQKDNQLNRLYLWITIGFSVMAITIVAMIYYYYSKGKKNIRALTVLNREVGDQKDKLEFAMVELEKSNTDKERILKIVAHDLRNPISGIDSLAATVINDDLPEEDQRQVLNLIKNASTNSLTLINELLELEFRPEYIHLDKKPVDISEMVKQCTGLMQLIADKKGQKLLMFAPAKPSHINVDSERMERVINNLLGNAIKFSPPGEQVIIEIERKDNVVLIATRDKGMGIPPEMCAEVFNIFGSSRRKGTAGEKSFGLGLSICKQIVEAHNGKIWVQSKPGAGSVFYVELPLQDNI